MATNKQKLVSAASVAELIKRGLSVVTSSDSRVCVTLENIRTNHTSKRRKFKYTAGTVKCIGTDETITNEADVHGLSLDNYCNSDNLLDVTIKFVNCNLNDLVICLPYRAQNKADNAGRVINFKFYDCELDNFKIAAYSEYNQKYHFCECDTIRNVDFCTLDDKRTTDINVVGTEQKHRTFTNCVFSGRHMYLTVDNVTYDTCKFSGMNFGFGSNTPKPNTVFKNCYVKNCIGYYQTCPETGNYIGYKKVAIKSKTGKLTMNHGRVERIDFAIAMIEIPADAKRSSATGRKCRASKAKVLSITSFDGKRHYRIGYSLHNCGELVYRVGEMVFPDSFDENRWNECAPGIHHFITRIEAIQY